MRRITDLCSMAFFLTSITVVSYFILAIALWGILVIFLYLAPWIM